MSDSDWESIDFDPELQKVFEGAFTNTPGLNWKKWLDVSPEQEYEELVYKLTGLSADNLEDVGKTVTDPDSISIDSDLALTSSFEDDGPHFIGLPHMPVSLPCQSISGRCLHLSRGSQIFWRDDRVYQQTMDLLSEKKEKPQGIP
jgi:hypothetical protein